MIAADIGGDDFLAGIFAGAEGSVVIAKPTKDKGYFQRSWRRGDAATLVPAPWYWCCSTSKAAAKVDRDGVVTINRRKSDLARTCAIVLDDIGTKVETVRVEQMLPPPSAIIETSPGNFQWVYILNGGADPQEAATVLERLAAAEVTDAGAKDASHVFRLPGSINDKVAVLERNGGHPWPARVTLWKPERRYTLDEIVERVPRNAEPKATRKADADGQHCKPSGDHGLDILQRFNMVLGQGSDGGVNIRCPWSGEHSGETSDSATTYWPRKSGKKPGFKCMHGHCDGRGIKDLHVWLRAMDPTFDPRPRDRRRTGIEHAPLPNGEAKPNGTDEKAAALPIEWPDIDPGLIEAPRSDVPEFPDYVFPPKWREWIGATAEGAGAPVDYVGMGLLGNVAGVTGCGVFVEATSSWREPVVVWSAIIGAPSMHKSPALTEARRLIDKVESDARKDDADRRRKIETKIEAAKLAEERWRDEVAEAAKTEKPPPLKPAAADIVEAFVATQMIVEDTTVESLVDVVRGNPRGVILWRDELSGWLQNFSRYSGGNDRAFWLERWPAGPATVNRKNRPAVRVERLGVSIIGGIQPDRLGEICGDDDDGMASRFLFAWPERPPYKPIHERQGGFDEKAVERLQRISALAGNAEPLVLKLDAGARGASQRVLRRTPRRCRRLRRA